MQIRFMENYKNNLIVDLTFQFSLDLIEFTEILDSKNKFVISRQLLKSGTSIGANVLEAQNSESKIDFIYKLKIAAKEANETEYWLRLCKYSKQYPYNENLTESLTSINKILSKIISTSKKKMDDVVM